jgi:nicotinamidase-related amidase
MSSQPVAAVAAVPYPFTSSNKATKGAFSNTDLDLVLRNRGIHSLVITAITTDVCVSTTMREANDLGYECLVLSDCTAATDYANHEAALRMVLMQGGVFGAVATSTSLLAALPAPPSGAPA